MAIVSHAMISMRAASGRPSESMTRPMRSSSLKVVMDRMCWADCWLVLKSVTFPNATSVMYEGDRASE